MKTEVHHEVSALVMMKPVVYQRGECGDKM